MSSTQYSNVWAQPNPNERNIVRPLLMSNTAVECPVNGDTVPPPVTRQTPIVVSYYTSAELDCAYSLLSLGEGVGQKRTRRRDE